MRLPESLLIPPPEPLLVLPEMVDSSTVSVPALLTPAPSELAELPEIVELASVVVVLESVWRPTLWLPEIVD